MRAGLRGVAPRASPAAGADAPDRAGTDGSTRTDLCDEQPGSGVINPSFQIAERALLSSSRQGRRSGWRSLPTASAALSIAPRPGGLSRRQEREQVARDRAAECNFRTLIDRFSPQGRGGFNMESRYDDAKPSRIKDGLSRADKAVYWSISNFLLKNNKDRSETAK